MKPQPRVIHLDDGTQWRGGQHQVWLLMRELAAKGVPQKLASRPDSPLAEKAKEVGVDVDAVRYRGEIDFHAPKQIAALALGFGANILHAHTAHAHAAGLSALKRMEGKARLVTTRRVDFKVGRGFFSGRKYRYPNQHFIAISEAVRQVLIDGGVADSRIDVVFSGVPPLDPSKVWSREQTRGEFGIGDDEIAILNVGALTDHKGHRWLVEAGPKIFSASPKARIHIFGDGELRGDLEKQINEMNLTKRVMLHGHVPEARFKLAGFDLYVSSSHLEGLGTANLDAMFAGLPVVAAAAGGVTDVVIDGQTGRLCAVRCGDALAERIIEALRETEKTKAMVETARKRVNSHFTAAAMAAGTLEVYEKLLG